MKSRTIKNQLNYCITQNVRIGESKRAYKKNNEKGGQVFSVQYAENLRDTANQLAKFINERYPHIKLANDIKSEHVQAWIDDKSGQWTQKTLDNKVSQVKVLFEQMGNTFGRSDRELKIIKKECYKAHTIRDKVMDRTDVDALRRYFDGKQTESRNALEIAVRCGLRSKEISRIHSDCINTDKWVLEIREGAKNGKYRDVPIRAEDRAYFADLKARTAGGYVCKGVSEESLNKGIRRGLKDIGLSDKYPNSTIHAIRKLYATERMQQERAAGKQEREAWETVQQELGHGSKFRQALYNVYVKS